MVIQREILEPDQAAISVRHFSPPEENSLCACAHDILRCSIPLKNMSIKNKQNTIHLFLLDLTMCLPQELTITAKKTSVLHGEFKGSDLSMTEPTAADSSPLYHLSLHPTNGNCHCAPDQSALVGNICYSHSKPYNTHMSMY